MLPRPRTSKESELKVHLRMLYSEESTSDTIRFLMKSSPVQQVQDNHCSPRKNLRLTSRYICEICEFTFKSKQGLNQHQGKMHRLSIDGKECSFCGKIFKHKYALSFHIKQVHEKATRTECEYCGKSFYNKYEARKHLQNKHHLKL